MVRRLGVGVIGAGLMGKVHVDAYLKVPQARLVAIADIYEEKAKDFVKQYGFERRYTDYHEMAKNPEIDIVDVCLPTFLHAGAVLTAIEEGKHVLVEKPLAMNLEEADKIISAARRADVKLMCAHVERFNPVYAQAKKAVEEGKIGGPVVAMAWRRTRPPNWADWFLDVKKSGGLTVDLCVHDADLLRWFFGAEAERVYAEAGTLVFKGFNTEDNVLINVRFTGGGLGFIQGSWTLPETHYSPGLVDSKLEVIGTEGMVYIDTGVQSLSICSKRGFNYYDVIRFPDAYQAEVEHFVKCVSEDKRPLVTPEDAKRALEIVLSAKRSAELNEPVELPLG